MKNILTKKELKSRVFMRYGNRLEVIDNLEEFDINRNCTVLIGKTKKITCKVFELLYTNIYWKEDNKEKYKLLDDIDKYKENKQIFEINMFNGETVNFKPDYVMKGDSRHFLHYFDMSYFVNGPDSQRTLMRDILKTFDESDITFEYLDYFDFN